MPLVQTIITMRFVINSYLKQKQLRIERYYVFFYFQMPFQTNENCHMSKNWAQDILQ